MESGEIVKQFDVALRKESVDRNTINPGGTLKFYCRSPQGERG